MNQDKIKNVAELIRQADAVLVGAGSGMSSAAGYNHYHCNEMFKKYFKDFEQTYQKSISGILLCLLKARAAMGILFQIYCIHGRVTCRTAIL